MIITKSKDINEILGFVKDRRNIFLIGCGSCAEACRTGGEKEVLAMKDTLESHGKHVTGWIVPDETCHIPLTKKLIMEKKDAFEKSDAIVVLACGAGVQTAAIIDESKEVYPGLDSMFLGNARRVGDFFENCSICGECVLGETAAICPVTRCPKGILNGPCGGMDQGKCELDRTKDCAWVRIYERMKVLKQVDRMKEIRPPKDYSKRTKPAELKLGERARSQL